MRQVFAVISSIFIAVLSTVGAHVPICEARYTFGLIDDLSFEREGNRLRSVSDAARPLTYAGGADFAGL